MIRLEKRFQTGMLDSHYFTVKILSIILLVYKRYFNDLKLVLKNIGIEYLD